MEIIVIGGGILDLLESAHNPFQIGTLKLERLVRRMF
jgi:hypothetical protein